MKYELDIHVFVTLNCLISLVASLLSDSGLKSTVVNRTLHFFNGLLLIIHYQFYQVFYLKYFRRFLTSLLLPLGMHLPLGHPPLVSTPETYCN